MWKKLRGYVILQVQGLALDRFLRRLLLSGIFVGDISRQSDSSAMICIYAKDFCKLPPIRRRERCRIRILEKHGLPFLWKRLCRRPMILIGIPACVFGLWLCCMRIWWIRIEGTERTDPTEVRELLAEHGIAEGRIPKGNVLILAADDLSARLRDAAWVSLNRNGIVLDVHVEESALQHPTADPNVPADMIATKEATVVRIHTARGKCKVKEGQTVHRGDVLIAGHVVYSEDRTAYDTRADGEVIGACVYTAEADFPTTVTEYAETGETDAVLSLRVCGRTWFRQQCAFSEFAVRDMDTIPISMFGLPIELERETAFALEETNRILSERERAEQAELVAVRDAVAQVPHDARICSIQTVVLQSGERKFVRCTVAAEESIGQIREYGS